MTRVSLLNDMSCITEICWRESEGLSDFLGNFHGNGVVGANEIYF